MQETAPAVQTWSSEGSAPTSTVPRPGSEGRLYDEATLAPWYHTLGIVLLLLLYALVGHLTHRATGGADATDPVAQGVRQAAHVVAEAPRIPLYLSTVMLSWMLLASVVAGLYRRRAFFRIELQRRFRSRWADVGIGLAVYVGFLSTLSLLVTLTAGVLLLREHAASARTQNPASHAGPRASGDHGTPPSAADSAREAVQVRQRVERMMHVNRAAVAALAPRTVAQLLVWILLSLTAGFCEEHIFRGYLLRQSLAALHLLALPRWLGAVISVLATSVLFGSLHVYEGAGGAVIVGLLGAVFAVVALLTGNLRAVIIAHFLQDFMGGLFYFIAHLRHAL